jgi:DNA-directed RNA polymerase specialized sigma24 family protein
MELLAINETRGFERAQLGVVLERRVQFLDEPDRKLLEFTLIGRLSRAEAAMLLRMSRGSVSRRLRRIMQLLHDPLIVALIEQGHLLPETYRDVGLAYFLRQWSIARIARELASTPYQVKRALTYVRGWHAAKRTKT